MTVSWSTSLSVWTKSTNVTMTSQGTRYQPGGHCLPRSLGRQIGSQTGYIDRDNKKSIHLVQKFCKLSIKLKDFSKNLSAIAVMCSYYIFNYRNYENFQGYSVTLYPGYMAKITFLQAIFINFEQIKLNNWWWPNWSNITKFLALQTGQQAKTIFILTFKAWKLAGDFDMTFEFPE